MKRSVSVKNIAHVGVNGVSRISAEVGGQVLWFESSDIALSPSAEGFVSAILVPAMRQKSDIEVDAALDGVWQSNIARVMKQFGAWWKYRPAVISALKGKDCLGRNGSKTALCFSGGVDSFYSLLCSGRRVDQLVFIHGFDIPLSDTVRFNAYFPSLQAIAAAVGARLVVIRTNIREHDFFRCVSWDRSHGGVLAATGHFMVDTATLVIPATYPYKHSPAWGSHWKTDPLFSSSRVNIIHDGALLGRNEKAHCIADEMLARKYLRVCWEQKNGLVNCCRCEKCLRTMLSLEQCKKLGFFETFSLRHDLLQYIGELPFVAKRLIPVHYRAFVYKGGFDPALQQALHDLMRRSCKGLLLCQFYFYEARGYYKKIKGRLASKIKV